MECGIESRKSISREPETRRWFPEPGKKEPCTNIHRTAKRPLILALVPCIFLVLKYNFKNSTGSPYLFVFSLENTSVIAGAGQANFPEAVHNHFCRTPKKIGGGSGLTDAGLSWVHSRKKVFAKMVATPQR